MLSKLFKVRVRSKDYQGRTWIIRRRFGNRTVGSRRRSAETEEGGHLHRSVLSNPNILNMYEVTTKVTRHYQILNILSSCLYEHTIFSQNRHQEEPSVPFADRWQWGGEEENLSNYIEPYGSALLPCAPGQHHQLRIWQSLIKEKEEASDCDLQRGEHLTERDFF